MYIFNYKIQNTIYINKNFEIILNAIMFLIIYYHKCLKYKNK